MDAIDSLLRKKEANQSTSKSSHMALFQEVAADFYYHAGKFYLIIVDCYSHWPTIILMGRNTTASQLETGLQELFS